MRFALVFCYILFSIVAIAQQRIVFELKDGSKAKEYRLPKSVTCTFNDGTKQRLVLEAVNGDSLIFRKYYNQQQNFDCIYSSLKKIRVHKSSDVLLYSTFITCSGTAILMIVSAFYLSSGVQNDAGDPSLGIASFLISASVLPITGAIITGFKLPPKFKTEKWTLYAK